MLLSKCTKRKNVVGDRYSHASQYHFTPPRLNQNSYTIEHGRPHKHQRKNLRTKRYRPVFSVVSNIRPQLRMVEQPIVQPIRSTKVERSRQQQKGCGW